MTRSSSSIATSPCFLGVSSDTIGGGYSGMTCGALGIRSTSLGYNSWSKYMFVTSINFSIYLASSWYCICSPSSLVIGCAISSTCISDVSSIITPFLCSSSYFYFSSLSLLLHSYYSFNFFFISYNSLCFSFFLHSALFIRCSLFFSLFLHFALFIRFSLFTFDSKVAFMMMGSVCILQLSSPSWLSTIFFFHFFHTRLMHYVFVDVCSGTTIVCGETLKFLAILMVHWV